MSTEMKCKKCGKFHNSERCPGRKAMVCVICIICFMVLALVTIGILSHPQVQFVDDIEDLHNEMGSFVKESTIHTLQIALKREKIRSYVTLKDWSWFDQKLTLIEKGRVRAHHGILSSMNLIFLRSVESCRYADCQHILDQTPFFHLNPIYNLLRGISSRRRSNCEMSARHTLECDHSKEELQKQRRAFEELKLKAEKAIAEFETYEPSAPPKGYTAT